MFEILPQLQTLKQISDVKHNLAKIFLMKKILIKNFSDPLTRSSVSAIDMCVDLVSLKIPPQNRSISNWHLFMSWQILSF